MTHELLRALTVKGPSRQSGAIEGLPLGLVETLFDFLPRSPYFVKDASLRYVSANAAMLDLCGVAHVTDMIGKTARDFFPEPVWRRYEALDRQVMRTQKPVKDQLELALRKRGRPTWLLFVRWPIIGADRASVGVAAIARNLEGVDQRHPAYDRLARALDHIHVNFRLPIDNADLSRKAGLSVSQLERDFGNLLGMTPRRYLTKVRFEAAIEMLSRDVPIVEISQACGYADQSSFTRAFRVAVGLSPSEFRRRHIGGDG